MPLHASLTASRWAELSVVEQLANIGSEVDRTLRAHEAGRIDRRDHALARALELFDLTAADPRWCGPRRREVLRTREYFCAVLFSERGDPGDAAFLRKYFLEFATAARHATQRRIANPDHKWPG
jgi:hypothetical protein